MTQEQQAVTLVLQALQINGYEAYLVGGCVRDLLLHRVPKDYDVCTNATPEQIQGIFKKTIPVGAAFGVIVVVVNDIQIEVATFRSDGTYSDNRRPDSVEFALTPKEDVMRRDFTMNGILMKSLTGSVRDDIVDYVGGYEDIQRKRIRAIGGAAERFKEDALRMLRAVRFAAQLGFRIDVRTVHAIEENAELIKNVSRERVRMELFKILESARPELGIFLMVQTGLLGVLFPDLMDCKLGWVLRKLRWGRKQGYDALTMLALLGSELEYGQFMYFVDSLKLSADEMEKLRSAKVHWLELRTARTPSRAELVFFMRRKGAWIALALFGADNAIKKITAPEFVANRIAAHMLLTREEINEKPLVTGDDLIALGHKPGPIFGNILHEMEVRQLNRAYSTREDALAGLKVLLEGDPQEYLFVRQT